jgi:uncharacterized iron-regulated membrane protein
MFRALGQHCIGKGMAQAKPSRSGVRSALLTGHRWLSLAFAAFWLLQAVTGMAIIYHWEIEDAAASSLHRPTDFAAIEKRVAELAPRGGERQPTSLWVTAGFPDRYKLTLAGPDDASIGVRLAGDGTVLERTTGDAMGVMDVLVLLHQQLLAGETGEWIIGISGIVLLSNLILGLIAAWPRAAWRRALAPVRKGPPAARSYSWHRAVGLWAVLPAIVLVGSGTLLRFDDTVGAVIGAEAPKVDAKPPTAGSARIGLARAVATAQAAIPGSAFTAANWPSAEDATWRLRMLEPGEKRRAYGTSTVYVDAETGNVRAAFPASRLPPAQAFLNALFAVHTGEYGGFPGRVLAFLLGAWLATMIVLGLQLWWRRRSQRK